MEKLLIFTVFAGIFFINVHCENSTEATSEKLWTEEDRQWILDELNRTTNELMIKIEDLSDAQWNFRESPERWSINEIVEHLEIQNELHYRQIMVVSNSPQMLQYVSVTKDMDEIFSNYATDTLKRQAKPFLEPIGRFCSKAESIHAFNRARYLIVEFVKNTDVDLRKHFSFSNQIEGKSLDEIKPKEVFDLHQLLLLGIAHTDRHLRQIRAIKKHPNYIELQ